MDEKLLPQAPIDEMHQHTFEGWTVQLDVNGKRASYLHNMPSLAGINVFVSCLKKLELCDTSF